MFSTAVIARRRLAYLDFLRRWCRGVLAGSVTMVQRVTSVRADRLSPVVGACARVAHVLLAGVPARGSVEQRTKVMVHRVQQQGGSRQAVSRPALRQARDEDREQPGHGDSQIGDHRVVPADPGVAHAHAVLVECGMVKVSERSRSSDNGSATVARASSRRLGNLRLGRQDAEIVRAELADEHLERPR